MQKPPQPSITGYELPPRPGPDFAPSCDWRMDVRHEWPEWAQSEEWLVRHWDEFYSWKPKKRRSVLRHWMDRVRSERQRGNYWTSWECLSAEDEAIRLDDIARHERFMVYLEQLLADAEISPPIRKAPDCPYCGAKASWRVFNTEGRPYGKKRRRRKCEACGRTGYEDFSPQAG